jgi:hypothetical protein
MNPKPNIRYVIRLPDGRCLGRYSIHGEIVPVPPVFAHTFTNAEEARQHLDHARTAMGFPGCRAGTPLGLPLVRASPAPAPVAAAPTTAAAASARLAAVRVLLAVACPSLPRLKFTWPESLTPSVRSSFSTPLTP